MHPLVVTIAILMQLHADAPPPPPALVSADQRVAHLEAEVAQLRQELTELRQALVDAAVISVVDPDAPPRDFAPILTPHERKVTSTTRPSMFQGAGTGNRATAPPASTRPIQIRPDQSRPTQIPPTRTAPTPTPPPQTPHTRPPPPRPR